MEQKNTASSDLKREWIGRFLASKRQQEQLAEQLRETRSRAASVSQCWNPLRSAPPGGHADRTADSVQKISSLENQLAEEQARGSAFAAEILTALSPLPVKCFEALSFKYIDGLPVYQIARRMNLKPYTVNKYIRDGLNGLILPENVC